MDDIKVKLQNLERLIMSQGINKEILSFSEACIYLDVSDSHLYKMTSRTVIPHYKPNGKKIYFKRQELDNWMLSNKQLSNEEIEQQAQNFLIKRGRAK